jgi:hypothetical protein
MIDMRSSDPISFMNSAIDIGSRFIFVEVLSTGFSFFSTDISVDVFFVEALSISERRDEFSFFGSHGGGRGVSVIAMINIDYALSI